MTQNFAAPWSTTLKMTTSALLFLMASILWRSPTPQMGLILLGVVGLCLLFSVRGYSINNTQLLVRRLGWSTKIDLGRLQRATHDPNAMGRSIRTFGAGGLFASVGYFYNLTLGSYRAYATNRANTVVLDFGERKVVVTPDQPETFVQEISSAAHIRL